MFQEIKSDKIRNKKIFFSIFFRNDLALEWTWDDDKS